MLIDDDNYQRCFSGFALIDCAVRGRDTFYFVTLSDYDPDEPPPPDVDRLTRVNICFAKKPMDQRWKLISFNGFDALKGAVAREPLEQFIGVDRDANVVSFGSGKKDLEKQIPSGKKGPVRGGVRRVRSLFGKAHISTGYRGLARRDGLNQWVSLCDTLVFEPSKSSLPSEFGFEDFDAFDPDDFYCVGGEGDVWHRGLSGWTQLDFPTNQELTAVCCAGDGFVYIGAQSGSVWKGRDDTWRLIHRGDMTLPFRDIRWFGDRVYCTSDHGLWEIQNDRLQEANVPEEIKVCSGNLDVGDGVMLLAGVYGAAYLEGDTWTRIYDTFTFTGPPPGSSFP